MRTPLTFGDRMDAKQKCCERLQEEMNDRHQAFNPIVTAECLGAVAHALHAEFPQYDQYWKSWHLCRCHRRLVLKHQRVAAEVGDYALAIPNTGHTVFCLRTGGNVGLNEDPHKPEVNDFPKYFEWV